MKNKNITNFYDAKYLCPVFIDILWNCFSKLHNFRYYKK